MHNYKYFLIIVSISMSIVMYAGDNGSPFKTKRRKVGASSAVFPGTPERWITGRAYASHLLDDGKHITARKHILDILRANASKQAEMDYKNASIISVWGDERAQLITLKPAFHLVLDFLRPPVLCKKNHEHIPSGDPLLPDQSLFDE